MLAEHGKDELPSSSVFTGELHTVIVPPASQASGPYDMKNPYYVDITEHRELMEPSSGRSCMHIEFNIKDTKLNYLTGDHLGLFPANSEREVDRLLRALRIDNPDTLFSFEAIDKSAAKQSPFPTPCSYRTALTYYLDITAAPRTHIIKALADNATTDDDREFFEFLASHDGKDKLASYVVESCRTVAEILEDRPNLHAPVDLMLELLPRLQCRYYSIASSAKVHSNTIHICASLVEYQTPLGRFAQGVTTGWLSTKRNFELQRPVPAFVRKSNFKLPGTPTRPVIFIGPGTGIAPFRAFIHERNLHREQGRQVGPTVLFFGCRTEEEFLYKSELRDFEASGLLELHVAFSRLPNKPKQYVQHLLVEQRERMWDLISQGAYLYVCGDAKNMARDVQKAVVDMVQHCGGKTEEEAIAHVKHMKKTNRYLEDVWS